MLRAGNCNFSQCDRHLWPPPHAAATTAWGRGWRLWEQWGPGALWMTLLPLVMEFCGVGGFSFSLWEWLASKIKLIAFSAWCITYILSQDLPFRWQPTDYQQVLALLTLAWSCAPILHTYMELILIPIPLLLAANVWTATTTLWQSCCGSPNFCSQSTRLESWLATNQHLLPSPSSNFSVGLPGLDINHRLKSISLGM